MQPPSTKTLKMSGLSPAAEQTCGTTYNEFLKDHGLQSYPLDIAVVPWGLTQVPQQYSLKILLGDLGVDHSGYERLTKTPEADLNDWLREFLEWEYEHNQAAMKTRTHPTS